MKRKHAYLLVCLALVGALVLTSVALGDKGSGSGGNGNNEAVHHSNGSHTKAHKRHHRRHRHHARQPRPGPAQTKLEGNVTAIDGAAKTITLALDDSSHRLEPQRSGARAGHLQVRDRRQRRAVRDGARR